MLRVLEVTLWLFNIAFDHCDSIIEYD